MTNSIQEKKAIIFSQRKTKFPNKSIEHVDISFQFNVIVIKTISYKLFNLCRLQKTA